MTLQQWSARFPVRFGGRCSRTQQKAPAFGKVEQLTKQLDLAEDGRWATASGFTCSDLLSLMTVSGHQNASAWKEGAIGTRGVLPRPSASELWRRQLGSSLADSCRISILPGA